MTTMTEQVAAFLGRAAGKTERKYLDLKWQWLVPAPKPIETRGQLVAEAAEVIERQAADRVAVVLDFNEALRSHRERKI